MDNNTINKLIFDTLSARKSILIDGIGTVAVVRKGSNQSHPKKRCDFPRYELTVNNATPSVNLRITIGDDEAYNKWFATVCKQKGDRKKIIIPNCVEIKMKSYMVRNIVSYPDLELQLNPFSSQKKSNKALKILLLCLFLLVLIGAGLYFYPTFQTEPYHPIEQKIPIPEKVAYVPDPNDPLNFVDDSTDFELPEEDSITTESVKPDTTIVSAPKPEEKKNEIPELIKGNSYIIIGSFKLLSKADEDKARLQKTHSDIVVNTALKSNGYYVNYIYASSNYSEAMKKQKEYAVKYPDIKGIWVFNNK